MNNLSDLLFFLKDNYNLSFHKRGKIINVICPFCKSEDCFVSNVHHKMICHACKKKIDFFNYFIMTYYSHFNFDLVEIKHDDKIPIEKDWTNQEHKSLEEWHLWLSKSSNIGVKTGERSNLLILDIDTKNIDVELKQHLKNYQGTIQKSTKGFHYFFKYDKDLPKTHIEKLKLDIETTGGQVVVCPSVVKKIPRCLLQLRGVPELSLELKQFLLNNISVRSMTTKKREILNSDTVKNSSVQVSFSDDFSKFQNDLINVDQGTRNNFLVHFGGVIRKKLNFDQTEYILNLINKNFVSPPLRQYELNNLIKSLDRYIGFDSQQLARRVLDYLRIVEEATSRDVREALQEKKESIDKSLSLLVKEGYLFRHRNSYHILQKADWKTSFLEEGREISFKFPYFDEYTVIRNGDLVLIGAGSGSGKCLSNGFVLTNQGMRDIKNIGQNRKVGISKLTNHIRIYDGRLKRKNYQHPNYFYKEKVNNTIKIKTYFGFELEGTPEHRIKVIKTSYKNKVNIREIEFKKLEDLKVGDNPILVGNNLFPVKNLKQNKMLDRRLVHNNCVTTFLPDEINEDIASFMGYVIGDGSVSEERVTISQDNRYVDIIKKIKELGRNFGLESVDRLSSQHELEIMFNSKILSRYITKNLFERKKIGLTVYSPDRKIPSRILNSNRKCQIAFISALFDCKSSIGNNKKYNLSITMINQDIIKTLHYMLLNFGIVTRLTTKNVYWNLNFSQEMTKKFLKIFKCEKYKHLLDFKVYRSTPNLKKCGKNQFSDSYYFIDKIVDIKNLNEEKFVYDFNMDNKFTKIRKNFKHSNQFWSNGFISHNSHVALNMIKQVIDQGISPYYVSLESGNRFISIGKTLGIQDKFKWCTHYSPEKIELEKESITFIDWILPKDYAMTDKIFEHFSQQLNKNGGIVVAFVQLRNNDTFFAQDMTMFFPALVAKFLYEEENNREYSYFETVKIREPKHGNYQHVKIPCRYDWQTKELKMIEEQDVQISDGSEIL